MARCGGIVTGPPAQATFSSIESHIRVIWPPAALGRNPGDVLIGVFDIAGFAVDAVLGVDHEPGRTRLLYPLIDAGRAIPGRGPSEYIVLGFFLQRHVSDMKMNGLIFFMIRIGQEHRLETVEGNFAVRLRIANGPAFGRGLERVVVRFDVLERAK